MTLSQQIAAMPQAEVILLIVAVTSVLIFIACVAQFVIEFFDL